MRITLNSFIKEQADNREPEVKMVGKPRLVRSAGVKQTNKANLIIRRKAQ